VSDVAFVLVLIAAVLAFPAWKFLTRLAQAQLAAQPKPGELWRIVPPNTPWPEDREPSVHRVLDVRDGFVRHAVLYKGTECQPDCTELVVFMRVFKREYDA